MILHRSLAEDQHDFQFPEIPFIPRSFSSRSLSPQRSEVCAECRRFRGEWVFFGGNLSKKCIFLRKSVFLGLTSGLELGILSLRQGPH